MIIYILLKPLIHVRISYIKLHLDKVPLRESRDRLQNGVGVTCWTRMNVEISPDLSIRVCFEFYFSRE